MWKHNDTIFFQRNKQNSKYYSLPAYVSALRAIAQKYQWICSNTNCKSSNEAIFEAQFIPGFKIRIHSFVKNYCRWNQK